MKNIIPKIICGCLGLALLAGCQSTDSGTTGKSDVTNPTHVAILFSRPAKAYTELGGVSTYKVQPDPGQTWQNTLQKQAAARGADAVLVDTSTLNNSNSPLVSGTAIRFQPEAVPPAK